MDPLHSVCLGSFQTGFPREPDDAQQLNTSTSTVRDAFAVLGQHSHTVVPSSADFGAMVRLTTPPTPQQPEKHPYKSTSYRRGYWC